MVQTNDNWHRDVFRSAAGAAISLQTTERVNTHFNEKLRSSFMLGLLCINTLY